MPVISVCAVRTGCGKSPVSRRIAAELRKQGWNPVVIRHPMPYGDLVAQRCERFATMADLDRYECTIEEREEYEPHIAEGTTVYAGVDYYDIMKAAEQDGDVILWDGGNNDTSFYRPDLDIVVLDPHRPGHELAYYPGEVNFRTAHVLIINKVDTADPDGNRDGAPQYRATQSHGAGHRDGMPGHGRRSLRASRASACWWSKTARP